MTKILQRMKMAEPDWMRRKVIRWMEDNRGLILTLFGLPLSFLFDQALQVPTAIMEKDHVFLLSSELAPPTASNIALKATPLPPCSFSFFFLYGRGGFCLYKLVRGEGGSQFRLVFYFFLPQYM
jgi:hypothetical protein